MYAPRAARGVARTFAAKNGNSLSGAPGGQIRNTNAPFDVCRKRGYVVAFFSSLSSDMWAFCSGYAKHATRQQRRYVLTTVNVDMSLRRINLSLFNPSGCQERRTMKKFKMSDVGAIF